MARIRRLNCFDGNKIKKMISYLGADEGERFSKALMSDALVLLNLLFPLKYKFLPESFILIEKDEILGLITVIPTLGNPYKINITKLVFQQNYYDAGKQLVEFVIAKYGAKGATSFTVSVDESHMELFNLFVTGCGFRQCSSESLWKVENYQIKETTIPFRTCQNSDSKAVSRLFNGELISHCRPALERLKEEYQEPFFAGLSNFYKNRYVLEDPERNRIILYLSITTSDNINFFIDISKNEGYDISFDDILNFALKQISKRKSDFCVFIKLKKYIKTSSTLESQLRDRNFNCVQSQFILVKEFYKPIKQQENALQVFLFGDNGVLTSN